MAFVYRAEKLKKPRPNTALGPGQYLPITETKLVKSNEGRAPFESSVKKFNTIYGESASKLKCSPGPGKYYQDPVYEKSRKLKNLSSIKYSGQEEHLLQEKYLAKTGNNIKTKYDINKEKEVLGFEVKDKRFKNVFNLNPGPGDYFIEDKSLNKNKKSRAKSAMEFELKYKNKNKTKNKNKIPNKNRKGISAPSIPFNDNGFEIDANNSLIKLEDPNEFMMFRGDKKESVGPGSYDLDNPQIWLKNGTSWSKMKSAKGTNQFGKAEKKLTNVSKISTRPQSALEISQHFVSTHSVNSLSDKSNMSRANTAKMLKDAREQRKWNMIQLRKDFKDEIQRKRNKWNRIPLLANDIYDKELERFNNKQSPGPGYYVDIEKESSFYKRSIPYPEFRQFFLSNNERFPEEKIDVFLGPTSYFKQNIYYKSSFNTNEMEKKIDINKIKQTPFSTREKRFNSINSPNGLNSKQMRTPGPGSYDPFLVKNKIKSSNNTNNMFNTKQKRFGPSNSELNWIMMTPGPGDYINPYTATGTRNTLLINGIYTDIRKGKEILRQKAKTQKPLKSLKDEGTPGVGSYDPDKVQSIAYQNRKKAKERKENEKLKIAFDSHMKNEKDINELKSNLGPGIYYKELPVKAPFIRSPFQSGFERMKDEDVGSGLEPGHYNVKSYFDWNKKTYNVSYL